MLSNGFTLKCTPGHGLFWRGRVLATGGLWLADESGPRAPTDRRQKVGLPADADRRTPGTRRVRFSAGFGLGGRAGRGQPGFASSGGVTRLKLRSRRRS